MCCFLRLGRSRKAIGSRTCGGKGVVLVELEGMPMVWGRGNTGSVDYCGYHAEDLWVGMGGCFGELCFEGLHRGSLGVCAGNWVSRTALNYRAGL